METSLFLNFGKPSSVRRYPWISFFKMVESSARACFLDFLLDEESVVSLVRSLLLASGELIASSSLISSMGVIQVGIGHVHVRERDFACTICFSRHVRISLYQID